jgi:hypothetical protein
MVLAVVPAVTWPDRPGSGVVEVDDEANGTAGLPHANADPAEA